jgi:uncharacterized protein YbbK (DUF523 family)
MVIVSSCLVGLCTRYDGSSSAVEEAILLLSRGEALPFCPEQLAGLPTPRPQITLVARGRGTPPENTRVLTADGTDITERIQTACNQMVQFASIAGVTSALLKEGSPTCGVTETNMDWHRCPGTGVLAAALLQAGVDVKGI